VAQLAASLGLDGSLRRTRIISQLTRSAIATSLKWGSNEAMSEIFDAHVHQIIIEQHGER
jgi:hypothetical protein